MWINFCVKKLFNVSLDLMVAECCLVVEHFGVERVDFVEVVDYLGVGVVVPFAGSLEPAVLVAVDIADAFVAAARQCFVHSRENFEGVLDC